MRIHAARCAFCTITFLACGTNNGSPTRTPTADANADDTGTGGNNVDSPISTGPDDGSVVPDTYSSSGSSPDGSLSDGAMVLPPNDGAARDETQPEAASPGDGSAPGHGWEWNGVIGTGQSLSVGVAGAPTLTTPGPFHNLKLSLGTAIVPPYNPMDPALSVVPLVEPIRTGTGHKYPHNIAGESPHTSMADQISALNQKATGADYVSVHTVVGESGQRLSVIDKSAMNGGQAYAASLFEVAALKRLAMSAGKTYGVGAITLTHGEADNANPNYEAGVYQLLTDYNTDIAAITGQTKKVQLFISQQNTGSFVEMGSVIAAWKLGVDHPGEVVCTGPKYQYPYAGDHLHLVAKGYDELGEKYGEIYYERIVLGHDWQPLQPVSATRAGGVITVQFHVPNPPLAWDTTLPAPHQTAHQAWMMGKGFEVANMAGEQTISSVAIQGNSVVITLASVPDPAGLVVRYAMTSDVAAHQGGLATGQIGQLRDSDPLVGYSTQAPQYNYAVTFFLPVN